MRHFSLASFSLLASCATAQYIYNLSDVSWTVSNGVNATVPGKLPSHAHIDLLAAGVIEDPIYGFNEWNQFWVQRMNWTYTSGPIKGLKPQNGLTSWLVFEGLDTFCEIKLCNQTVGNTKNQFRKYTFDVSDILPKCSGDPVLSLNFGSASKIVLDIAQRSDLSEVNSANGYNGQEFQGRVYMRKEESDFGWDWGPQFSPAGPWRPAYIVQKAKTDPIYITNTAIDIFRQGQMPNISPDQTKPFIFNASIDYIGTLPKNTQFHLKIVDSKGHTLKETNLAGISQSSGTITGSTVIGNNVNLWWPSGYGEQPLYTATLSLINSAFSKPATVTKRVGFRTIVLNLNAITAEDKAKGVAPGASWKFEINGHELYAKGSNFVPPDILWPRVNQTKIKETFELAINSHFNMMRIWSSGAYLPDWAYDLADEMGLLLWSEFQFSVAYFPATKDFIEEYEAEAYYNARRVNHHPSLALWAGGNELEYLIYGWWLNPRNNTQLENYETIFQQHIAKCVYANTHSISYIPSSTYHGYTSLDFNSVSPQTSRYNYMESPDALYADTDFYNYDGTIAFQYSGYPVGRFADEFGFPSMPSVYSWQEAIPESEFYFDSSYVRHHNRHLSGGSDFFSSSAGGINQFTDSIKLWYPLPQLQDPVANFTAWTWTSQVFQADYYQAQIAFYRRGSGLSNRQMGALYWQFNDIWVGPTWSSTEHSLRQKVAYYAAKDIFNPVIVWPFYDEATDVLEVWVVSDLWQRVSGTASFKWVDWQGNALDVDPPVHVNPAHDGSFNVNFNVQPINATRLVTYPALSTFFACKNPTSNTLLSISVEAGGYTHSAFFHPQSLRLSSIADPGLVMAKLIRGNRAQFKITATKGVAAWVWLDYPTTVRGYFDQNGFWLNKGESRTVTFSVWDDWSNGDWINDVVLRSIYDNVEK
ncbi:glycoside hydrolase family 2 protein [Trichoderma asperellum CBS 433.97]|uniref:Beta-mannosidase A n=3 Tax=Trichoderma asperellum TaxID=101201 RepID=A0A2T3YUI8_TRIA4|nr:glycoside hydrolase family 2 protein [Trichoderma asperellum CBS 433.97]PTB36166.1 glycoside hydrolase family 2 protein [Trichoderma asperellum CBS 433.97]